MMMNEWQGRQGRLSYTRYLRSKLFDFIRQFLTLARVLPFGRFFTLHNLQEMQMFLFQLFLLRQKFVETNSSTWRDYIQTRIIKKYKDDDDCYFYLACLTAWIQALQSLSDSARNS
jgi:hypothetical protein